MAALLGRRSSGRLNASLLLTQLLRVSAAFPPGFYLRPAAIVFLTPRPTLALSSGYTVTWLPSRRTTSLLAAGAPRYQHVGRVLLFQEPKGGERWSQIQKIDGIQVSVIAGASAQEGVGVTLVMLPAVFRTRVHLLSTRPVPSTVTFVPLQSL